jgi:hypothetical protein
MRFIFKVLFNKEFELIQDLKERIEKLEKNSEEGILLQSEVETLMAEIETTAEGSDALLKSNSTNEIKGIIKTKVAELVLIADSDLPHMAKKTLLAGGFVTLNELNGMDNEELTSYKGVGKMSLDIIRSV